MDKVPHVMDNWKYYYGIATSKPELKEFKDLLVVHFNKPHIPLGESRVSIPVKVKIETEEGPKTVTEIHTKTFDQLIKELAPKDDSQNN
jgi:hypothetical protein